MKCHICGHGQIKKFLSLGHQPPSDAFVRPEDLNKEEVTYPLDLFFCSKCSLVQLGYAVDPEILFRDYVYNSGSNKALKENFAQLVGSIVEKGYLKRGELAVDVGSNDGTLLENYLPHDIKVLGIDPSSVTAIAIEKGIPTIVDFFNKEIALKAAKKHGEAKVVTATNVFAHVMELDSFMEGVVAMLAPDGVFISESAYVVDMIEHMSYDQIYHEHLRYYGVTPLAALFERFKMEIIDIERIESHGGSIRIYAAQKGAHTPKPSVGELLNKEKVAGYTTIDVYHSFAERVSQTKFALLEIIFDLKKSGARIVGIGAPAKGNTLLNYCKLDPDLIDYLAEHSDLKIGRFSPGMHIPVLHEDRVIAEQPEAALMLSWNIAELLMEKLRTRGYKGKFIIPNPSPRII